MSLCITRPHANPLPSGPQIHFPMSGFDEPLATEAFFSVPAAGLWQVIAPPPFLPPCPRATAPPFLPRPASPPVACGVWRALPPVPPSFGRVVACHARNRAHMIYLLRVSKPTNTENAFLHKW